jgi:hypothetical protein
MPLELFWIGLVVKGLSLMASNTVKHHSADGYQDLKMQRAGYGSSGQPPRAPCSFF